MNTTVTKKTKDVLDKLTNGLTPQNRKRNISNSYAYMPVVVELISGNNPLKLYSVTHYNEVNGDLVTDPEMVFARQPEVTKKGEIIDSYTPVSFEMGGVKYEEASIYDDQSITKYYPSKLKSQIEFADTWMKNIEAQQDI